jgi:ABC-type transport system involved in multi-copper enzyme maturation permease subunit
MSVDAAPVPGSQLTRAGGHGPLRGLGGLTAAELRRWFPWRALAFSLVSVVWAVGFFLVWLGPISYVSTGPRLLLLLGNLFGVWSILLLLMMVATAQGAMASEIGDGTAAWATAKPVGRPAFVLAKFLAAVPGVLIGAIAVPGVVIRFILVDAESRGDTEFTVGQVFELLSEDGRRREEFTTLPGLGSYFGILLLLAAILVFVVALMILLGTVIRSRAAIFLAGMAVPIAMLIYGLTGPSRIVRLIPAAAFDSLIDTIGDDPAPLLGPVLVTLLWSVTLVGAAMAWFSRREL